MYPVECTIPYDEGSGKIVRHYLNSIGEWVEYPPNPKYQDRRIVFLPTLQAQQEAIKKNPVGELYFTIPTDVLTEQMETLIRKVVDERLVELGLVSPDLMTAAAASKKTGKPRTPVSTN